MPVFFAADHHFGHDNIRRYCARPFSSVEEMDETMIERWNKVVKPGDTVYHLGDFAFRVSPEPIRAKLNGRIVLVRGNHDRRITKHLFDEVYDLHTFVQGDIRIVLCHYGMRRWDRSHLGSFHLFGHSHGNLPPYGKSFDIGVDCHDFRPLPLDEVVEKMRALPENVDMIREVREQPTGSR